MVSPLMEPFKNTDFYWNQRLGNLVLPYERPTPAIRLLNSMELLKYIAQGGTMKRRQELEKENPDLFCSEELTKKLLVDLDKRTSRRDLVFFPGIVALSYAWLEASNPDPNQAQLKELAPILEWLMSERALLMMRSQGEFKNFCELDAADAPTVYECGVFIDFMCMNQLRADECSTLEETTDFEPVRHNIPLLFAHALTMQLRLTETPDGAGERMYSSRGWCLVEDELARLVKKPEYRLNISEWKNRNPRFGSTPSEEFGTEAGCHKSVEELAGQGDCYAVGHAQTLNTLKDTAHRPLMSHYDMTAELSGRVFGVEEDREACSALYSAAAECLLGERTTLELQEAEFEDKDWLLLGNALGLCRKLSTLTLRRMQLNEACMQKLCDGFIERGCSLPALTALNLTHNALLGGVEALATAVDSGAFPALETLNLCNAKVEAYGFRRLVEAMSHGRMASLTQLDLSSNALGDSGMTALLLLPSGALPNLSKLHLYGCNIGDDGCFALIQALTDGAMPKLSQMDQKDKEGHVDIFRRRNSISERAHSALGMRGGSSVSSQARLELERRRSSVRPQRTGSIGMVVGQNVDLSLEAKEALSAVLGDRSKGHMLVQQYREGRLGGQKGEMELLNESSQEGQNQPGMPRRTEGTSGSACCSIS